MSKSIMLVDGKRYDLDEVILTISKQGGGDKSGLVIDIFADCQDRQRPGIAINQIDLTNAESVEGGDFTLDNGTDDVNDLCESCLVEPNCTLELDSLHLRFGVIHNGYINIQLDAICHELDDATYQLKRGNICVSGNLLAKVIVR